MRPLRGKLTPGFLKWQHSKTLITHDLSAFAHCVISALQSHTLCIWFINVREVGMQVIHQTQFKEACQHVYSEKSGSLRSSRSAERESEWERKEVKELWIKHKGQKKLRAFSWMRRTMSETGTFIEDENYASMFSQLYWFIALTFGIWSAVWWSWVGLLWALVLHIN